MLGSFATAVVIANAIIVLVYLQFRYDAEDDGEDRVRLLAEDEEDIEAGGDRASTSASTSPPPYARRAESLSLDLDRLSASVGRLEAALRRRTERPLFDDDDGAEVGGGARSVAEEAEAIAQEVQRGIREAHRELGRMREAAAKLRGPLEARLAGNMVRAMTTRLKEIMERFGGAQTKHLKSEFTSTVYIIL